jgi:signal transduction histidine kinase
MQPLDLREIAERAVAMIERRSKSDDKTMAVELIAQANLPRITGDPGRVSQILSNLVDNAYNYTPPGGRITVTLLEIEAEVHISVEDNGIGIGAGEREQVFERFYRGEDPLVLATAGTGLGLSIVRQLVEMHGGRIWLESSGVPGQGSTFSFSLPIYTSGREISHEAEYISEVSV